MQSPYAFPTSGLARI